MFEEMSVCMNAIVAWTLSWVLILRNQMFSKFAQNLYFQPGNMFLINLHSGPTPQPSVYFSKAGLWAPLEGLVSGSGHGELKF